MIAEIHLPHRLTLAKTPAALHCRGSRYRSPEKTHLSTLWRPNRSLHPLAKERVLLIVKANFECETARKIQVAPEKAHRQIQMWRGSSAKITARAAPGNTHHRHSMAGRRLFPSKRRPTDRPITTPEKSHLCANSPPKPQGFPEKSHCLCVSAPARSHRTPKTSRRADEIGCFRSSRKASPLVCGGANPQPRHTGL